jgi:hypothetical protein
MCRRRGKCSSAMRLLMALFLALARPNKPSGYYVVCCLQRVEKTPVRMAP